MTNLSRANEQLYSRPADERFETLDELCQYCQRQKVASSRFKEVGQEFRPILENGELALRINGHAPNRLNDWSFTQLCSLAGVAKETVNRLSPTTAAQALAETLRQRTDNESELQALVENKTNVRAINGERYKRLWNVDILATVKAFAADFTPPQKGFNGATGLYAGEQDLFAFLIDATSWAEIDGEAFAPGFFVWNSEVGKRSVGIQTFWFQSVCANHIVWDAVEVTEFQRTHAGKASRSLWELRDVLESLIAKRDERRDSFAKVIARAMREKCGDTMEDDLDVLREPRLATHSSPAESLTPQDWHIVQGVMADLQEEGRCPILAGGLTRPCPFLQDDQACGIYPTRPNACVAMEAGDEQCQSSRAAAGLPPLAPIEGEFSAR